MTSKEMVLKVYPDAAAWSGHPFRAKYRIMPMKNDRTNEPYRDPLGFGETEEAAWQNAAEPLPAATEQELTCGQEYRSKSGAILIPRLVNTEKEIILYTNNRTDDLHEVSVGLFQSLLADTHLPAIEEAVLCPKCNRPHYNMEESEFCRSMHAEEETPCPKREDGIHCNCWYDGNPCCACGNGKPGMVAEPKPTPSAPERVQIALRRIMNRVEVISNAGEFDVRDSHFIENELLDVWDHHSLKPQPRDSSSISTEQTFIEWWVAYDETYQVLPSRYEAAKAAWAAAKGQSNGQ